MFNIVRGSIRYRFVLLTVAFGLFDASTSHAIRTNVTFFDPFDQYRDYYEPFRSSVAGAAAAWGKHLLVHPNAIMDIEIGFHSVLPAAYFIGGDFKNISTTPGERVLESPFTSEFKDGIDLQTGRPDAQLLFGNEQLELSFFDPDPFSRTEPLPEGASDAVSVLIHELGHAFGFTSTGNRGGNGQTVWDTLIEETDGIYYFVGDRAVEEYGAPVPMTEGSVIHLGNPAPLPGDDLTDLVMHGRFRGFRRDVSSLEATMLADMGYRKRSDQSAPCDVAGEAGCDIDDMDAMVAAILTDTTDPLFDLNGDSQVDVGDLDTWRSIAGTENQQPNQIYLNGDTNLDGVVDLIDNAAWQIHRFSKTGAWSKGDLNADGFTDGSDFNIWNDNRTVVVSVPETSGFYAAIMGISLLVVFRYSTTR